MSGVESDHLSGQELDRVLPGALTLLGRLRPARPAGGRSGLGGGHYACVERRCDFRLLGAHFSWSKSVSTWSGGDRPAPGAREATPRRWRSRRLGYAIGGIAGGALAAAAVSAAFLTPAAPRASASLLVPLPPPIELRPAEPAKRPAAPEKKVAEAKGPEALEPGGEAESGRIAPKLAAVMVPEPPIAFAPASAGPLTDRSAVRDALARAFRSGETESWSDNGVDGFVVVGAAEAVGGRTCRDIAVLARDGSFEGNTASGRKCLTSAGALVNP